MDTRRWLIILLQNLVSKSRRQQKRHPLPLCLDIHRNICYTLCSLTWLSLGCLSFIRNTLWRKSFIHPITETTPSQTWRHLRDPEKRDKCHFVHSDAHPSSGSGYVRVVSVPRAPWLVNDELERVSAAPYVYFPQP